MTRESTWSMETMLAQAGNRKEPVTGAVSFPVHHATTFAHPGLGHSTGFDYTRTQNPTRKVLEEVLAEMEEGLRGFAFSSGMAAVHAVVSLVEPGGHIVASDDLYGGTYRLLEQTLRKYGVKTTYVDTSDVGAVRDAMRDETQLLLVESPTNPTMKVSDIRACSVAAHERHVWMAVDNTFMTPYFQQPLKLGADIVIHSGTKYLGGHNDVLAGAVIVNDSTLVEKIAYTQNSIGAVLGPDDCWLLLRGMKTLALRMERHDRNASVVAQWLTEHALVDKVYYPGLHSHSGRSIQSEQATGFGGMLSFELIDSALVEGVLGAVQLVTFAESLGGVESLITFPARQTHADIPADVREAAGVTDRLLRLSVGIEDPADIIEDLKRALRIAGEPGINR